MANCYVCETDIK